MHVLTTTQTQSFYTTLRESYGDDVRVAVLDTLWRVAPDARACFDEMEQLTDVGDVLQIDEERISSALPSSAAAALIRPLATALQSDLSETSVRGSAWLLLSSLRAACVPVLPSGGDPLIATRLRLQHAAQAVVESTEELAVVRDVVLHTQGAQARVHDDNALAVSQRVQRLWISAHQLASSVASSPPGKYTFSLSFAKNSNLIL